MARFSHIYVIREHSHICSFHIYLYVDVCIHQCLRTKTDSKLHISIYSRLYSTFKLSIQSEKEVKSEKEVNTYLDIRQVCRDFLRNHFDTNIDNYLLKMYCYCIIHALKSWRKDYDAILAPLSRIHCTR